MTTRRQQLARRKLGLTDVQCWIRQFALHGFCLGWLVSAVQSDETHSRYFDQLRERGLFALAESEAISRLATQGLSLTAQTDFTIELSRTLADHAGFVADDQRDELWQRARKTVQEVLDLNPTNPRAILLEAQFASVLAREGEWLRAEREVRPFDEPLFKRSQAACTESLGRLSVIEKKLAEPSRESVARKGAAGEVTGHELRTTLHQVRWHMSTSYRNRAELVPLGSNERAADLLDAERIAKRLIGSADEPLQTRARLQLVTCARLKGEREQAGELLTTLEKIETKPSNSVSDEIVAERLQLLIESGRPTEAAELLLKTRSKRLRLSGELWFLQMRTLIAMCDVAATKQQTTLVERLHEQVNTTIERCEEQVGGYWSRRCRQLWENTLTTQKYGSELDAIMQQARTDYAAGRVEAALTQYAAAEHVAIRQEQLAVAMELGYTRASILLDQKQFEPAANEFLRLATEYPTESRAASAHLLGTYCLGRSYDTQKTQPRREAYESALNDHLQRYARDPTVNEANFLKARLEEQRLQFTRALPLYLQVEAKHSRAPESMAGAARCYETILRRMSERHLEMAAFDSEAIHRLTAFLTLAGDSVEVWNESNAEVALRLTEILLLGTGESPTTSDQTADPSPLPRQRTPFLANQNSRTAAAERWLEKVTQFTERSEAGEKLSDGKEQIRLQIIPLQIISLAANGKLPEAERRLNSLAATSSVQMVVVERLTQLINNGQVRQRDPLAKLITQAADRLRAESDPLSKRQLEQRQRILGKAYLAVNQPAQAVVVFRSLTEQSANNVEQQREFAQMLCESNHADAVSLAKQCWRRVESLTKPGTAEWLSARLGVIRSCWRLKQTDEARKLWQLTKVLYPELGGAAMKPQFDLLDRELNLESK